MRTLMIVVVLLVVGIAGFGYYRGWFVVATNSTDKMPSATITVDKDKFHEDEKNAQEKVRGFEQDAKKKIGDLDGKTKEPQRQP